MPVRPEPPDAKTAEVDEPVVPDGFPFPIVLGIDPGTHVMGYGALVLAPDGTRFLAAGVLRAPARLDVPRRLGLLQGQMRELLQRIKPRIVSIEKAFTARNMQSALRIGEGRGMVLACAAAFGAEVAQYAPASAKKAVVGNGQADKEQVARMVEGELGIGHLKVPLDATDALALALTHVQRMRESTRLARMAPGARRGSKR